jgi:molybdenum cofactor cytidylyltransferase
VLLAAGGSARLGRPKQLAQVGGETLVRRAAAACLASAVRRTHVVVGAHGDAVAAELAGLAVEIVANDRWAEGMSSSIRAGLAAAAGADGVLLVLADQPGLRSDVLDALARALETPASIAACAYGGGLGAPAAFGRAHFPALAALHGDEGARRLLARHAPAVIAVAFPEGELDVDREEDLERARAPRLSRGDARS